jgi:release factor glutamine methyltransferase
MEPRQPDAAEDRTFRALIQASEDYLRLGYHPERARLDAETLLLRLLQRAHPERNRAWLLAHMSDEPESNVVKELGRFTTLRRSGRPVQYITGQAEFFGLAFATAPEVLIPRPETEHLVEEALRLAAPIQLSSSTPIRIADIGTGTGAIAVALAHSLPDVQITATDISSKALTLALANAESNQVADRIEFLEGDLVAPLAGRKFSIVVSNPPYIPLSDKPSLSVEVRDHEPHLALFAGYDGLLIHRRLIPDALAVLEPGGWLLMEIGYGHQLAVEKLLREAHYVDVNFIADYQSIPRVAVARRP